MFLTIRPTQARSLLNVKYKCMFSVFDIKMVEALLKIFSLAKIVRWNISFIFKNYKIIFYIICTCGFPAVSGSWFFKNLTNLYPDPYLYPNPNPGNLAISPDFLICSKFFSLSSFRFFRSKFMLAEFC
jgi:hypothetical protein